MMSSEDLKVSENSTLMDGSPVFALNQPLQQHFRIATPQIPHQRLSPSVLPCSNSNIGQNLDWVKDYSTYSGKPPIIKQECTANVAPCHEIDGNITCQQEPPFIKQEPPFIKQEPPFIKQELSFIKQEPGLYSADPPTFDQEPGSTFMGHDSVAVEGFSVPFPSQPINLNFLSDIEDIVPIKPEVSIDDIKRELSSFDGPSDQTYPRRRRKIKPEDKPPWVPPLWQQQYENIRKMRAKRDAPVDKYGCFMNAERDVLPEVYRYQVLISLMLSSQTKDEIVSKAMTKLKENGLTVSNVLDTPQEEIARMIFPVGFWNKKAEYIKKTTKILQEKFNSDIPNSIEGLVSLPGIGPKIGHLIMDFAWNEVSGIAVDTHVHRITHRLGWMAQEIRSPEEARISLEKWFPRSEWSDLNLLFVGFGQQICSPVAPKCTECLNKELCPSSSCFVPLSGLQLGIGIEMSKGRRQKSGKEKSKKIKLEEKQ